MRIFLLLILVSFLFSCVENDMPEDLTAQKVKELSLYKFHGDRIKNDELITEWNEMINDSETPDLFKAGTFNIKKIKIADSDTFVYALVATNTVENIQTAALLTKYKDGYKISNRSVSCYGCKVQLELSSKEGYWSCNGNNTSCVKTSRLHMDNNIISNPDARILFRIQLDQTPTDNTETTRRTIYSIYTAASNKGELCRTKSLLSDIAYEETWVINDKNDPKQTSQRPKIREVDAQNVLEIICDAGNESVFFSIDLNKFGAEHKEFKAFFD